MNNKKTIQSLKHRIYNDIVFSFFPSIQSKKVINFEIYYFNILSLYIECLKTEPTSSFYFV